MTAFLSSALEEFAGKTEGLALQEPKQDWGTIVEAREAAQAMQQEQALLDAQQSAI